MMILDPADESAVEKETQKCSADLEERLSEITKDEIENAVKLSKRLRKRCDYFQAACKQKQDNIAIHQVLGFFSNTVKAQAR